MSLCPSVASGHTPASSDVSGLRISICDLGISNETLALASRNEKAVSIPTSFDFISTIRTQIPTTIGPSTTSASSPLLIQIVISGSVFE